MRLISQATHAPVEMRGISKRYGQLTALDNLDLDIEAGRVTSVLGPNGAGKTTAIKLMLGILRPDQGTVSLFGLPPASRVARSRTGAMMQISALPATLTVIELLDLFRTYYAQPLSRAELIEVAGLQDLERRLYGKLSGGQKQRLAFALSVCGDPDLLFMDEPTVGLDVETRRSFWQSIRALAERGKSIVLTTHYLEEADALSDRIVVLHRGAIRADGTPHRIKSEASSRKIRCVTQLRPEDVGALDGVRSARFDRAVLEILCSNAEQVVRTLLERDPKLRDLEVSGAGIEDAFMSLTSDDSNHTDEPGSAARKEVA